MVAPSLQHFSQILSALRALGENDAEFLRFIETETDMSVSLWREVHETYCHRDDEWQRENLQGIEELDAIMTDLRLRFRHLGPTEYGALVITNIGPQKLKVVSYLRRVLGLSMAEALALAAQREIVVGSGLLLQLHQLRDPLRALGGSTECRPGANGARSG